MQPLTPAGHAVISRENKSCLVISVEVIERIYCLLYSLIHQFNVAKILSEIEGEFFLEGRRKYMTMHILNVQLLMTLQYYIAII